ncbi:MAG: RHS repeat protein, partial [Caldilineaceae bacterium]|nr:RHS repeat protein [Caldilineaceae bacterium]
AFFDAIDPHASASSLLQNASTRIVYDLDRFWQTQRAHPDDPSQWQPVCAATLARETHATAPLPPHGLKIQLSFSYSDGFGREIQKKIQAEPGPLDVNDPASPTVNPRWVGSGWTILNNKGKPVKQYEPYFSVDDAGQPNHRFEEPRAVGVTPILYYDAVGRTVRTELPDGTFSRVTFSPWHITRYDANDTVREEDNPWYAARTDVAASPADQRAARSAAQHADTPATVFLDSLGREVISVAHNRVPDADPGLSEVPLLERPWHDERYVTFTHFDAEGKPLWIRDDRGNRVMEYITPPGATEAFVPCYDIAGNLLFQHSMDAGDRWMLMDSTGQPFYAWDENERTAADGTPVPERRRYHTIYDALRRPKEQQLHIDDGEPQLIERFRYGDEPGLFAEPAAAQARNLRGQLYQHYDPSGVLTHARFDFKGNLLEATRQLAAGYEQPIIDWTEGSPTAALDPDIYTQRTQYDALNRMSRQENWHLAARDPAIDTPTYNARGLLVRETLTVQGQPTAAIARIEYDAKGQRTLLALGNGTQTRYRYDPQTFRLTSLTTTDRAGAQRFQALRYTYDPGGNITEIYDDAYEPVFFRNQMVEPRSRYTYDALYRLIEATGRENHQATEAPGQFDAPPAPMRFPVTDGALRNYRQRYIYDAVGNIMQMRHVADRGSWTRHYAYAADSNRLLRT